MDPGRGRQRRLQHVHPGGQPQCHDDQRARAVPEEHRRGRHVHRVAAGQQPHARSGRRTTTRPSSGSAEFSTVVESLEAGKPIVAERAMYFDPSPTGSGFARSGHDALGVPEASSDWYFAEGLHRRQRADGLRDVPAAGQHQCQHDDGDGDLSARFGAGRDARLRARAEPAPHGVGGPGGPHVRRPPEGSVVRHHRASHRSRSSPNAPCTGARRLPRTRPRRPSPGAKATPRPDRRCWRPRWAFAEGREGEDASARPYSTFFLLSNPAPTPIDVQGDVHDRGRRRHHDHGDHPGERPHEHLADRRPAGIQRAGQPPLRDVPREHRRRERSSPSARCTCSPTSAAATSTWARRGRAPSPRRRDRRAPSPSSGFTPTHDAPQRRRGRSRSPAPASPALRKSPWTACRRPSPRPRARRSRRSRRCARRRQGSARWRASRIRLTTAGTTQTVGNIGRVFRVLAIGDSFTEGQLVERRFRRCRPATDADDRVYSFADPPYPEALEGLLRADPRYGSNADVDNEGYSGECASINGLLGQPDQRRRTHRRAGRRQEVRRRRSSSRASTT